MTPSPVSRYAFDHLCLGWWETGRPSRAELVDVLRGSIPDWLERAGQSQAYNASLRCWWPTELKRWCARLQVRLPELPEEELLCPTPPPPEVEPDATLVPPCDETGTGPGEWVRLRALILGGR